MKRQKTKAKRGTGLSLKVTVAVLLTLVAVMAIGSYLMCKRQTDFFIEQMKQEADVLADTLGVSLSRIMGDDFKNRRYMQRMTEELGMTVGVNQIEVYDLNRIVIADTNGEDIGKIHAGADADDVIKVLRTGESVVGTEMKEGVKVYSKTVPVYRDEADKKEMIGVAEISMSLAEIAELLTIKDQADVLATVVGLSLQKVIGDSLADREYIQEVTEKLGKQKGVDQIEIYGASRKVIADTDRNELGQIATGKDAEDLIEVLEKEKIIARFEEKEGKEVYSKTRPIYAKMEDREELAGALEVSMSVPYVQSLIASTRNEIILLTIVIIFAIGIITILLLRRNVISPILSLSDATKVIAGGDLSKRAEVKSGDEIGELAASFNQMTDEIQKRNEELAAMNEELRSTNEELETSNEELQSATEELEAANEELRRTQEELIQKEKLAAVGQLASGVGHELRNPLGVIKNAVYYIKSKIGKDDPKLTKHITIMEKEIANSNKIISDLLGFSRIRPPAVNFQDINKVVENTLQVVEIPENVRLNKELGRNLPYVVADADQMRQVFVNLSLNAIQAMPDGGWLKIATRKNDGFIEVEFADTGCGIPEENMKKLYDPFFTTKARGVGLGLAVTQGIIARHNGNIEVKSEVGKGTVFLVKLPVEAKEA